MTAVDNIDKSADELHDKVKEFVRISREKHQSKKDRVPVENVNEEC